MKDEKKGVSLKILIRVITMFFLTGGVVFLYGIKKDIAAENDRISEELAR